MVEVPHVLVGAAIAAKVGNPALALPLALASHFVLDLVPHWNPSIYTQLNKEGRVAPQTMRLILADSVLAVVVGVTIALLFLPDVGRALIVLVGSFLGVLPDVLEIPYYFWNIKHPLMVRYVEFNHSLQTNAPFVPGIATQIVVSLAAVWWIFT
ncbi:hypothetical protein HY405_00570 [Candidatus Microgenomates bacterium]|nr:hypothetical protein [Candidatus Microgenomates bacterium]